MAKSKKVVQEEPVQATEQVTENVEMATEVNQTTSEQEITGSFITNATEEAQEDEKVQFAFVNKSDGNPTPRYGTDGAAGMDICANIPNGFVRLMSGETKLVPTGIFVEIPKGFEIQVRSRLGMALKEGLIVLNSPGTVDCDDRGEIGVIIHNISKHEKLIRHGERIAQLVLSYVPRPAFIELDNVSELTPSVRDKEGFGSTGK